MKKNLKKVISAVLALTLAMSSFVAMTTSAATFADVADTASYAEAVNALAALGAIAGTGDGTFKPDDNITRAEAATMLVAALNLSADAQNAGSTSKFADVNEQAKWAVGYVNVGVAQNYISGTSATTFNPLDNVTYAQMLTMLTRILGYGDFAVSRGGYPDGYVTAASTAGIVKGVVAGNEEAITRAQAAQLIWNAVQAPMLDITTFTGSIADTELQQMDGTGNKKFKTVLSEKFDAYVLTVTIDQTAKSHGLEAGTVAMTLTNANEWDPEEGDILKEKNLTSKQYNDVAVGKTDAADHLFSSAKVVASYTSYDDEWELIYFAPNSKVTKKVVDGTLINAQGDTPAGVVITSETTDGTTWYKTVLNIKKSATSAAKNADDYALKDADLYVNGFYYDTLDAGATAADIRALIANSTGDMVLIENDNDKYYDIVMVDVYAIAQVTQVKASNDKTTVRLTALTVPTGAANPGTTLEVTNADIEDGEKIVTVTKDGAASTLAGLAIDDVVAIKYNHGTAGAATNYGDYIDVIASTKTASGVYTSYDPDTDLYTVGGVEYDVVGSVSMTTGNTYTLRLDPFGRVYAADVDAVSKNYAIIERFVKSDEAGGSEYDYIDIVTLDGQSKRLFVESSYDAASVLRPGSNNITASYTTNAGVSMANRFISYKVKPSTGRVTSVVRETPVAIDADTSDTNFVYYNASTNRLGSALSSTAVVLDAVAYSKNVADASKLDPTLYKASSLSALVGNVAYEGYLLHKTDGSNQYAYVVITSAGALYSTGSNFAVVSSTALASSKVYDEKDDEELYSLKVAGSDAALKVLPEAGIYVNGVKADDSDAATPAYEDGIANLKKGSVFFYTVDAAGKVDRIDVIYVNATTQTAMQSALKVAQAATAADSRVKIASAMVTNKVITADWYNKMSDAGLTATNELVQIFVAPVLSASASSVSFAEYKVASTGTDGNGGSLAGKAYIATGTDYSFAIAANANIYSVDAADLGASDAVTLGAFQGIRANYADAAERAWLAADVAKDATSFEYDFTDDVQYALVMAVDGVVTNAVVFDNVQ